MKATHLHFDPYSGISGDMLLGALVDLGVPVEELQKALQGLPIGEFALRAEKIKRQGLVATKVHVEVEEEPHVHRHLRHIDEIVEQAGLPPRALARAKRAYRRLAEAEATVHGSTPEKIHFHEVGAKDAIVDVAGAMVGFELLGIESFSAAPLITGYGWVRCAHGQMPVPAPATAELLRGMPQRPGALEGEMITPTGAAILSALSDESCWKGFVSGGESIALRSERVGYGAGTREYEDHANYLRAMLCLPPDAAPGPAAPQQTVVLLECEIDDMIPEWGGALVDRLMAAGALDVQLIPLHMKKNRPGLALRVLCIPEAEGKLAGLVLYETTTFGLRRSEYKRWALDRRTDAVDTPFGRLQVKLGVLEGEVIKVSPEFEDCAAAAHKHGVALGRVYAAVWAAAEPLWPSVGQPAQPHDE